MSPNSPLAARLTPRQRTWIILALSLGGFAIGTSEFASMGLMLEISRGLSISETQVGHLISAYAIGVVVGAPILAFIGASFPRRKLLLALMGFYAVGKAVHIHKGLHETPHARSVVGSAWRLGLQRVASARGQVDVTVFCLHGKACVDRPGGGVTVHLPRIGNGLQDLTLWPGQGRVHLHTPSTRGSFQSATRALLTAWWHPQSSQRNSVPPGRCNRLPSVDEVVASQWLQVTVSEVMRSTPPAMLKTASKARMAK